MSGLRIVSFRVVAAGASPSVRECPQPWSVPQRFQACQNIPERSEHIRTARIVIEALEDNVMSCSSGEALELSGRGRGAQRARVRARWCEIRARWCEMHGLACADAQVWWRRGDQRGDLTAGDLSGTLGPMACAAWYMVGARTCPRS